MKTYIFSNCKKTDTETYAKNLLRQVPTDAPIVLLNRGNVYYQVKEFLQYKNQVLIMRQCHSHGIYGFFGLEDLVSNFEYRKVLKEIIGLSFEKKAEATLTMGIGFKEEKLVTRKIPALWAVTYRNATKKEATTGYAAYHLVQTLYRVKPEDIVLVNFYGSADNSTPKWCGHNWDFEDKWLKDKNRIYC